MAQFLTTTGVSHMLEELVKGTKIQLVLVTPYFKLNDRIRELIDNLLLQKLDIRIVCRENNNSKDNDWLERQSGVRVSICKNLHAKCYLNESAAIVTSMNLYEFSQQNNNEMGIYINETEDVALYQSVVDEVRRILCNSVDIQSANKDKETSSKKGYCIRTGVEIEFDVNRPYSSDGFKEWLKDKNRDAPENFCHFSGEKSLGKTSMIDQYCEVNMVMP